MTVLESIQRATDFLEKKGVDSPRLQSELLLAHVLELPRLKLYLQFNSPLSPSHTDRFRKLVQRRGQREPLQHILGTACFCGLEIRVGPPVLVPRPETELLAECAWDWLKGLGRPCRFLDFGTGSGCIAIAICHYAPAASAFAIDACAQALAQAQENATHHGLADRIQFLQSTSFAAAKPHTLDLIVSNPPYIPTAEIATLQPEVRDFDPHAALDGGADGLGFYRLIAREGSSRLANGGRIMLEFGDGQAPAISEIFQRENCIVEKVLDDYTRRPRVLIARASEAAPE